MVASRDLQASGILRTLPLSGRQEAHGGAAESYGGLSTRGACSASILMTVFGNLALERSMRLRPFNKTAFAYQGDLWYLIHHITIRISAKKAGIPNNPSE